MNNKELKQQLMLTNKDKVFKDFKDYYNSTENKNHGIGVKLSIYINGTELKVKNRSTYIYGQLILTRSLAQNKSTVFKIK